MLWIYINESSLSYIIVEYAYIFKTPEFLMTFV